MPGTVNTVPATLIVRQGTAANWLARNPVLTAGEFGLETDTFLLKMGDGVRLWISLPYINKFDSSYFGFLDDGTVTFSDSFKNTIAALEAAAG